MTVPPFALLRRLVLVSAFGLAIVISGAWQSGSGAAQAAEPAAKTSAPSKSTAPGVPPVPGAPAAAAAGSGSGSSEADTSATGDQAAASSDAKSDVEQHAIVVEKGGKRVRVVGIGDKDRDYDTVNDFIKHEPELYGMVIAVVAIIFLSPVFLIAIVMWYRMRKARLLNETLLQLAEKGAIAPGEAMQALGAGQLPSSVMEPAMSTPGAHTTASPSLLDQAKQARKRAAWSDLRKGVIVGAIGLAFTLHDLARGHAPDMVGLILLFIGAAYAGLWWYETRHLPDRGANPPGSGT